MIFVNGKRVYAKAALLVKAARAIEWLLTEANVRLASDTPLSPGEWITFFGRAKLIYLHTERSLEREVLEIFYRCAKDFNADGFKNRGINRLRDFLDFVRENPGLKEEKLLEHLFRAAIEIDNHHGYKAYRTAENMVIRAFVKFNWRDDDLMQKILEHFMQKYGNV